MNEAIRSLLLQHTRYITHKDIISDIRDKLLEYLNSRDSSRSLYINLYTGKIGSEQWLYTQYRDLLSDHKIISSDSHIQNGSDILYIDDWILSGCNACGIFEDLMYDKAYEDIQYIFISSISTSGGRSQISSLIDRVYPHIGYELLYSRSIEHFDRILERHGYDRYDIDEFNRSVNPNTHCGGYPIVSDYKIANQHGSYPSIYEKIYKVDRSFMENIDI